MDIMMDEKMPWPQVTNVHYGKAAVVIVGAGIGGMCTAIDLIRKNNCRNFIILERSSGIGGTWNDNRYPGCCCDIPSMLYSLSFEQNPNWTRRYPGQEEILQHLHHVAEKWGLYRHIRFNSKVTDAEWDDAQMKWKTTVKVTGDKDSEYSPGYTITSDFLVAGVGQLNEPALPMIDGMKDFKGKIMHTARWDWSYPLEGKRIAVIGNGATGIQVLPELVKVASHVTQYSRTPGWLLPRLDAPIPSALKLAYRSIPGFASRARAKIMDFGEGDFRRTVWNENNKESKWARSVNRQMLQQTWPDNPEMWEKLTPTYPPGCKRILFSDDYYPALKHEACSLETRKIERFTENGIEVEGGNLEEFDLVVLATGFHARDTLKSLNITGRNGRNLHSDIWSDIPQALYGVTVEDVPNFGILYGPNTNLNHNSIILMIEAQSNYINGLVEEVLRAKKNGKALAIHPKVDRIQPFNKELQEKLSESSYGHPACASWYKAADGKRVVANWMGSVIDYQKLLSKIDWDDFNFEGSSTDVRSRGSEKRIGRVIEETRVSNLTLAISVLGSAAVMGGLLWNAAGLLHRLRVR